MKTVTVIGSGRFEPTHRLCLHLLAAQGFAVLGHGSYTLPNQPIAVSEGRREVFDLAMLDKICQSDVVFVVDVDHAGDQVVPGKGYVGEETAREMLWATMQDTPIVFLGDLLGGTRQIEQAIKDFDDAFTDGEIHVVHIEPAIDIYDHVTGRDRAIAAQGDTKDQIFHAALSYLADTGEPIRSTVAQQTLDFLGLVPMAPTERDPFLALIDPNSSLRQTEVVIER